AVDRAGLRAVQTPQAFRADLLRRAYRLPYRADFTDDASVFEAAGLGEIVLTQGDPDNIKITNPRDLAVARLILADRKA
ncbi:MAG: 2-C-methyl-D-erythritol 4-phosphate cytidylyltransferase, partial [Terasakiella sp.]|nr:2-C-methyl-D-erythritol 4-phosphate cytidylyltransferase [Terasakiella sp.]